MKPINEENRTFTRRAALRMLLGAGSLLAAPKLALGATEEELRAQAEQTQAQIDAAQERYNEVQAQLEGLAAEIQQLSIEQAQTLDQIYGVEEEIARIRDEIALTEEEIAAREQELAEKQERLGARISSAYKSGGRDFLSILLSSSSFEELESNIYYLDKISENDAKLIADVKAIKADLEERRAALEASQAELEARRSELKELNAQQEAQMANLRAVQDEVSGILAGLDEEVQALVTQRDAELLAAEREAERARQAAAAASASSGGSYYSRVDTSSLTQGATGSQQAVINAAYSVPSPGSGLCAWWVEDVFEVAGVGSWGGNACDLYNYYCYSSDQGAIQPGMIVAVSTYPSSGLGAIYGHVGIYVGGGIVMENIGYINSTSLSSWIADYGGYVTPRWGWMGGVARA